MPDTSAADPLRSVRRAPILIRAWFSTTGRLIPGLAERQAARLFVTPRRRKGPTPGELHPTLLPDRAIERRNGEGMPSLLALETGTVPVWSWGRGPTVVLVHGWSGGAGDLAPIAAALVRAGWRTILFDMPGHGQSSPRPTNLLVYLRTLTALVERLGPIDAIVGHSLGGTTTALALGRGAVHAERAALVAPGLSPWEFSRIFAETIGLPAARIPGMVTQTERIVGGRAEDFDPARAVSQLATPALFLHDPDDLDVPFQHSQALSAAWPGSQLIARPGLGHRKILRDPDTIARIVEFIAPK